MCTLFCLKCANTTKSSRKNCAHAFCDAVGTVNQSPKCGMSSVICRNKRNLYHFYFFSIFTRKKSIEVLKFLDFRFLTDIRRHGGSAEIFLINMYVLVRRSFSNFFRFFEICSNGDLPWEFQKEWSLDQGYVVHIFCRMQESVKYLRLTKFKELF